ncbi:MAG: gamma-glutamylcyclotransferase family protein [Oceanidesulfovibrio sp.]
MSDHRPTTEPASRVFVYGTLKCGYHNHSRLCREHAGSLAGFVRGRVVDRPEGFPTLFVPVDDVLAAGSDDLRADCRLIETLDQNSYDMAAIPSREPWHFVAGEVYTFRDGAERLQTLDMLEDYIPGEPSMYCRVALPVRTSHGVVPCWAYISPHSARFQAEHASQP